MTTRAPSRVPRATQKKPGDRVGTWTFVELIMDGPSAQIRRWLMACDCGWQAKRYEYDATPSRLGSCQTCAARSVVRGKAGV